MTAPPDGLTLLAASIDRLAAAIERAAPAVLGAAAALTTAAAEPEPPPTRARVDNLIPDDVGIIAIRHGLGAPRVAVRLFAADQTRVKYRLMTHVTDDEVEVIVEDGQPWPSYAKVEAITGDE